MRAHPKRNVLHTQNKYLHTSPPSPRGVSVDTAQVMRQKTTETPLSLTSVNTGNDSPPQAKDRRGLSVMSKRIDNVLRDTIIPLSDKSQQLPTITTFHFTEHDTICSVLADVISRDCPNAMAERETLVSAVGRAYDEIEARRQKRGA